MDGERLLGPVEQAVTDDIALFAVVGSQLANSTLAASALALARELDAPRNSATSKSMCSKELREIMDRLRELAPVDKESDVVDELRARRKARVANRAAAPHSPLA